MLFITHDLSVLTTTCQRLAVMYAGRIVEEGPSDEVFGDAAAPVQRGAGPRLPDDRRPSVADEPERSRRRSARSGRPAVRVPVPPALRPGDRHLRGLEVGFGGVWVGAAPYLLFIPMKAGDNGRPGRRRCCSTAGATGHARDAQHVHLGTGRLALRLPRRVHALERRQARHARRRAARRSTPAIWRYPPDHGTSSKSSPTAPAIPGASTSTTTARPSRPPASSRTCTTSSRARRYKRQAGKHFNPYTYDDIKTIADHLHWVGDKGPHAGNSRSDAAGGGHAHAGAMIYLGGDSWPAEYRGAIFMNNIHGARTNIDRLQRTGSGYAATHGPDFLLANDAWSQMLNFRYGPDGNVYVIDWYDKNQCHSTNPDLHQKTLGPDLQDQPRERSSRCRVDLAKLSSSELVELQLHRNDWYVQHARRMLQERGPDRGRARRR